VQWGFGWRASEGGLDSADREELQKWGVGVAFYKNSIGRIWGGGRQASVPRFLFLRRSTLDVL